MDDDRDAGGPETVGPGVPPRGPRVETAVTPIIDAEPVPIPTPAWGALSAADTEVLVAELVDTGTHSEVGDWAADAESAATSRSTWLGWSAFALAVATAVVHGVAIVTEAGKDYGAAGTLAWIAIGLSLAAVVVGITAAALGRGRSVGIAAAIIGAIANPWLLLQILSVLQG